MMPRTDRVLTRAARDRATRRGERYSQARAAVLQIRQLAGELDCTYLEAEAEYDDPANAPLCEVCGWTLGMICPECPRGCGCEQRCSGWRHREYRHPDDRGDGDDGDGDGAGGCPECGAGGQGDPYGECVCPT